ncbi:unnamed protein product, partial [Brassica oleracea]
KALNTSKFFILVLLCKNRRTTTLHSKLLYSRLEEENFHSIILFLLLYFEDCPISYVLPRMSLREGIGDLEDRPNPIVNIRICINILE